MKTRSPLTPIESIHQSLRCFVSGCFGLVPILGLPFALYSALIYLQAKRRQGGDWNPAQRYLVWGAILARIGLLLTLILILTVLHRTRAS